MKPVVLDLVLTHHWFDEIAAGRKDIEYRARSPHWAKTLWARRENITRVRFRRGYSSHTIVKPVLRIDCGPCPYPGWSGLFYRIHIGKQD